MSRRRMRFALVSGFQSCALPSYPEGTIQDSYALGCLLPYTKRAFSQPEDRELLPAIPDDEPEVVILTPDQPAGASAATASVDEAGLPAREGEPAGSANGRASCRERMV